MKSVLSYKKPAFWISLISVIAVIVTAVCLLTSPNGQKLKEMESINLSSSVEAVDLAYYGDGSIYKQIEAFDQNRLHELINIRVSKTAISSNRNESRDKSHTIVLQISQSVNPFSSKLEGVFLHFNKDFTKVWVDHGVKPTLSYRVLEPKKAKKIYHELCKPVDTDKDKTDATASTSGQPTSSIPDKTESKPQVNFTIVDRTVEEKDLTYGMAFEEFYRDSRYIYEFSVIKSQYVEVRYPDGRKESIKDALKNGTITIADLDHFQIHYSKKTLDGRRVEENNQIEPTTQKPKLNAEEISSVTIRIFSSLDGGPKQKVITDKNLIGEMVEYWNSVPLRGTVERPKPGTTLSVLFENKAKFYINDGYLGYNSSYYELPKNLETQFVKFFHLAAEKETAIPQESSVITGNGVASDQKINPTLPYSKEKAIQLAFIEAQKRGKDLRLVVPDSAKENHTVELKSVADGTTYYSVVFHNLARKDGKGISAIGIDIDANTGKVLDINRFK